MKKALHQGRLPALAAAVIVGLTMVGTPSAALAGPANGTNEQEFHGPCGSSGCSYGEATWTASTDTINSMEVHPGAAFTTSPTHYCLASIFDWQVTPTGEGSGHFDPRIVRTCRSNTHMDQSFGDSLTIRSLIGMGRWGVCYGPTGGVNTQLAYCTNSIDADGPVTKIGGGAGPDANLGDDNHCARGHWAKYGVIYFSYYSGGNSTSCTS